MCALALAVIMGGCASTDSRSHLSDQLTSRSGFAVPTRSPTNLWEVPPDISLDDGVSEDEAVAVALWNNAAFHATLSELGIARADLIQAGQLSNPTFSVLFPLGPKQMEFALTLPVEALWLRPRRVAVAKLNERKVAEQLVQNGLDLIRHCRVIQTSPSFQSFRCEDAWDPAEGRLASQDLRASDHLMALAERHDRANAASEEDRARFRPCPTTTMMLDPAVRELLAAMLVEGAI